MAKIGTFQLLGEEFVGEIFSIAVQLQGVRFIKQVMSIDHPAATYVIYSGKVEIGYATECQVGTNNRTLKVSLDDPSFATAITADLIEDRDGTFSLIWSREHR